MSIFSKLKNKINKKRYHELITLSEAEKFAETYVGFNLKLRRRRLDLDFSRKEAAIKLDISMTELKLIENGYIGIRPEVKAKIITKYHVDESFFVDEGSYPTPIEKPVVDTFTGSKLSKVLSSLKFIIPCFVLFLGFTGMTLSSVWMSKELSQNTTSFYTENINSLRNGIINEHDGEHFLDPESGSMMSFLIADTYYDVNNGEKEGLYASLNVFKQDENITFTFLNGSVDVTIPILGSIKCILEMRMIDTNSTRLHLYVYQNSFKIATASVDYDWNNYEVNYIYGYDQSGEEIIFSTTNVYYRLYLGTLKLAFPIFEQTLKEFFETPKLAKYNLSYDAFKKELSSSVGSEASYSRIRNLNLVVGLIFATLTLMFGVSGILTKFSLLKKLDSKIAANNEYDNELPQTQPKVRKLPKNLRIHPFLPEFSLKLIAIGIMFISSIVLYIIFQEALQLNVLNVIDLTEASKTLFALTSFAIIIMFFTKLDSNENNKQRFTANFFLFFAGLLFYFLLIITKNELSYSETFLSKIGNVLLSVLPGNIVWGALAFNLLCAFLFDIFKFKKNNRAKTIAYRSLVIIPIAYLVFSSLITISEKAGWGWNLPYEIKALFFTKSFIIVVFAIVYVFAIFFLRRITIKKYGLEQAKIYMAGNSYCMKKNVIAALIILILGILECVAKANWPGNPLGLGNSTYILIAIPFVLLYRSHLGDRNKPFDLLMSFLYTLGTILGILLIASYTATFISGF